jgi:hypothetical protein
LRPLQKALTPSIVLGKLVVVEDILCDRYIRLEKGVKLSGWPGNLLMVEERVQKYQLYSNRRDQPANWRVKGQKVSLI